jgi:predicted HAD superfamily Cof-like phosphohydrolase
VLSGQTALDLPHAQGLTDESAARELEAPPFSSTPPLYLELELPLGLNATSRGWMSTASTASTAQPPGRSAAHVYAFHRAFHLPRRATPVSPTLGEVEDSMLRLRERLLEEETAEYMASSHRRDLVGMADALADIVYVAYGTAISFGLDLDALLDEVHRSNMSKLDERGRPVLRDDGKVLKSPRYESPRVESVIRKQRPLPFAEDL